MDKLAHLNEYQDFRDIEDSAKGRKGNMRKEKLQNAVWQFTNPGNLPGGKRRLRPFLSLLLAVVLCFTTVASMPGLAIKAKAEGEYK